MAKKYYRRKQYTGGGFRRERALRAKIYKSEKTKTTLKVLLGLSLAAVLALGGWLVYDHVQDNKAVPPTQIEQEVEDDTMLEGNTPTTGSPSTGGDTILDPDDTTTPETGDETGEE